MTQPKRATLENLPDTCGSCRHGHDLSGQEFLLCYGSPPVMLATDAGQAQWQQRGAPVEACEPCCHLFAPRCRA